jgi:hypothetical protein
MRDATLRKERAVFHKELTDLLTNVGDDKNYFRRLLWANEFIAHALMDFESDLDESPQTEDKEKPDVKIITTVCDEITDPHWGGLNLSKQHFTPDSNHWTN